MQNNSFKGGHSINRGSLSDRRQQARTSQTYCDVSRDGKEALLVQRSDLVNSGTCLKAKSFVKVNSDVQNVCGRGRGASNVQDRRNHAVRQSVQCPVQTKPQNRKQIGSDTIYNNATNNSSNKRSYFEPYDPRRSPGVPNDRNIRSFIQSDQSRGQYMHPQFMGYQQSTYYQHHAYQQPHSQYHRMQANHAATAVAPNGQTIYIPLDDRQYEIKKTNHDLYDMPVGCELLPLESAGEFESSVQLMSSPRPVDLKGGLSQDSEYYSGDSSDEVSYGEPGTDSEVEVTTDESEFVDNCVSDVLKTIAESVQSMTVEESKNIVERAIEEFEVTQAGTSSHSSSETLQKSQVTSHKSDTKCETNSSKRPEATNAISGESNTFVTEITENCFGPMDSYDTIVAETFEQTQPYFTEANTSKEKCKNVSRHTKNLANYIDKSELIKDNKSETQNVNTDIVESATVDIRVEQHSNQKNVTDIGKKPRYYFYTSNQIVTPRSDNDVKVEPGTCCHRNTSRQKHCEYIPKIIQPGSLQNDLPDPCIIAMSSSQSGIDEVSNWQPMHSFETMANCNPAQEKSGSHFYQSSEKKMFASNNDSSMGTNIDAYLNSFEKSNINRHFNAPKPDVITNQPEIENFQHSMYEKCSPVTVQNEWLIPEQKNDSISQMFSPSKPDVIANQPEVENFQYSMYENCSPVTVQNEWLIPEQDIDSITQMLSPSKLDVITNQPKVENVQYSMYENCSPVTVQNEWLIPEQNVESIEQILSPSKPDVITNQPEVVNYQRSLDHNYCPVAVQNEWLIPEQNVDSVEQTLSPLAYGPVVEDAVYVSGNVMIDGQGFFKPSEFQTGQNQPLYLPDNYTYEAYQPAHTPSIAPAYTFFIHDACPPPQPEVVCCPIHKSVSGELISVTDATSYESQFLGASTGPNGCEYADQTFAVHQPPSLGCDATQSVRYTDHQYIGSQPASSFDDNNVANGRNVHKYWDTGTGNTQQHDRHENVMLGSNQAGQDSVGQYSSQTGQFFVCYDEESVYTDPQSGLSFPAMHMTEDCLITVIFREGVCLEISADKSMRLVNHERKLVAAMSGNGEQACIIHPAARIFQSETSVDAALFSNRRAKMADEFIMFGNNTQSYKFDHRVITPVDGKTNFMDLSGDESVKFLYTDDGMQPKSQEMRQRTVEILAHAHFWKHGKCGSTVIINGTKVVQSDRGDVSVYCGPIKFIRMIPKRSVIRLKTQLFEADIETNWNVKLTRGHLALNVSHLGLIVSNGKIKGCIDNDDKLQAFSLPDHRVLMLGQAISQHRPGVPAWHRRRNRNRNTEPEGDHRAYIRPMVDDEHASAIPYSPGFDHTERGRDPFAGQ